MIRLEILTEEISMENFLRGLLPRILPADYYLDVNCFIRPHEGKDHLRKSLPRKLKAYQYFGYPVKVLVVHDQDSNDCRSLKDELSGLCSGPVNTQVRIVCRELESWYFGDLNALERVYPDLIRLPIRGRAKYRVPDALFGAQELGRLTTNFTKSHASRQMGELIDIHSCTSESFQHFVSGLLKFLERQ